MNIQDEVVLLLPHFLDKGGSTTLNVHLTKKLKLNSYGLGEGTFHGIRFYKNLDEVKEQIKKDKPNLKAVIFDNTFFKVMKDEETAINDYAPFKKFFSDLDKEYNRHIMKIYMEIDRHKTGAALNSKKHSINIMNEEADYVLGYSKRFGEMYKPEKFKHIDLNLFDFSDNNLKPNYKNNVLGYTCRFVGFKGSIRAWSTVLDNFDETFTYAQYGFEYNLSKRTGNPSGEIRTILAICNSLKDKTAKTNVVIHKNAEEEIVKNKINAYNRYDYESANSILKNISLGFCPTMGIRRNNKRDFNELDKLLLSWEKALEYVNFEFADLEIPVLYSKYYINNYEPKWLDEFPELIYDDFEDAIEKAKVLLKQPEELERLGKLQKKLIQEKVQGLTENMKKTIEEIVEKG